MTWDTFISHASEDKDEFVRPFAKYLRDKKVKVWYDEFTLKIGDSLREKIDDGIKRSRYGIIVLSKNFLNKPWTRKELNGLFSKENYTQADVLLPILLDISNKEIYDFSPILADKFNLTTSANNIEVIAEKIIERIKDNLVSDEDINTVLSKFKDMNKFDIQNRIAEINYRLNVLYNYENEIESIEVPDHILDDIEFEKFYTPLLEKVENKYDFPQGLWTTGEFRKFEYDSVKKHINKWVRGKMTMKECDEYYFNLDFMANIDLKYVFFGFSNSSVDLKAEFYRIGTGDKHIVKI